MAYSFSVMVGPNATHVISYSLCHVAYASHVMAYSYCHGGPNAAHVMAYSLCHGGSLYASHVMTYTLFHNENLILKNKLNKSKVFVLSFLIKISMLLYSSQKMVKSNDTVSIKYSSS